MSSPEIPVLKDENGNEVILWKGTTKVITVTVKNKAGVAQDISTWFAGGDSVKCLAKQSLDDAAALFTITCAIVGDGTAGQFTCSFTDTHTATAYEAIILQFYRYDSSETDYSVPFEGGIWQTSIRKSLL